MKYRYEKDKESGLYSVLNDGGLYYNPAFTFNEARRVVACLNSDPSLTWQQIEGYVTGKTKQKPYAPNDARTKHQAIRMTDEHWQALGRKAASIVAGDKPTRASDKSNWQLAEMLRMIATDKADVIIRDSTG